MAKKKEADKIVQNDNKSSKTEGLDDEEPNFSDEEGYIDDVSDEGKLRIRLFVQFLHITFHNLFLVNVTIFCDWARLPYGSKP